jgi:ribosome maturation factor RimP
MPDIHGTAAEEVSHLIEPVLDELDLELVDVEYVTERGRPILRVTIDKPGGIIVDDCAAVSREIGDLIEINDTLSGKYVLEVSSPGLNRRLKKEKDFVQAVGKKVRLKTVSPIDKKRNFEGKLLSFEEGTLLMDLGNSQVQLSLMDLKKANLVYEFDSE